MAVVKVSRTHQYTRKISLQVFDRTGGSGNIRFNGKTLPGLSPFKRASRLTSTKNTLKSNSKSPQM